MPGKGTTFIQGRAAVGPEKSRKKTKASAQVKGIILGTQRASGVVLQKSGSPRGTTKAAIDQFGLATNSKYASLGPHCRQNVAIALENGFEYQGQSATTEEQVCFGELIRRGFTLYLGTSPRSFQPQSPIAGSIVDFEVWDQGRKIALRPMNLYWHGKADKKNSDEQKSAKIVAAGYEVCDIWSNDSLQDITVQRKFDQFFGR